jgi:hypothetical protein
MAFEKTPRAQYEMSGRMLASPPRAPTLDQAKAEFQRSWIAWTKQAVKG